MLILRLTNPEAAQYHIAAAFPSGCRARRTSACSSPPLKAGDVETMATISPGRDQPDGRNNINPEAGWEWHQAPPILQTPWPWIPCTKTASTPTAHSTNKEWWEGMGGGEPPAHATDWKGRDSRPLIKRWRPMPMPASPRLPTMPVYLRPTGKSPRAYPSISSSSAAGGQG